MADIEATNTTEKQMRIVYYQLKRRARREYYMIMIGKWSDEQIRDYFERNHELYKINKITDER